MEGNRARRRRRIAHVDAQSGPPQRPFLVIASPEVALVRRPLVLPSRTIYVITALFAASLMVRSLPLFVLMRQMKEARCVVALCSLLLMIALVAATLAYTAIRNFTPPTVAAATSTRVADPANHADDSDPLVTPAAIILAMVAVVAVTTSRVAGKLNHLRS
jgi:hypothetical protein